MPITPKERKDLPDPEATVFDAAAAAEIETRTTAYADAMVTEVGEAAEAAFQPKDADLTAIAALTTTPFGRELLTKASAAAVREALVLGTAALQPSGAFDAAGAAAAAQAASQPLDADLTAIAALTTTTLGRSLLAGASSAELRTIINAAAVAHASAHQIGGSDALTLPQYDPYDLLPYIVPMGYPANTTLGPTAKRGYYNRFTVGKKREFKFVRWGVGTVGTGATDKVDAAIFKLNGSKLERLASSGYVAQNFTSLGAKATEMTSIATCEPGIVYFVAWQVEAVSGAPQVLAVSSNNAIVGDIAGTGTLANRGMVFRTEAGAFPSSIEGGFSGGQQPWLIPSEV